MKNNSLKVIPFILVIFLFASCMGSEVTSTLQPEFSIITPSPISTTVAPAFATSTPTLTKTPWISPTAAPTPTSAPLFDTPGEYIIYVKWNSDGIYASSIDSGESIKLFDSVTYFVTSDGNYIARYMGFTAIELIDYVENTSFIHDFNSDCRWGELSPDMTMVACSMDQNMIVQSLEDGQILNLTNWDPPTPEMEYRIPNWSPDGRKIAYEGMAGGLWSSEYSGLYISLLDCNGNFSDCEVQTSGPYFSTDGIGDYVWSPDSRYLAVLKSNFDGNIYIFDNQGMAVGQVIDLPDEVNAFQGIAWSPDGEWLVFGQDNGIYKISISTMEIIRLFRYPNIRVLGWIRVGNP